MKQTSIEKAGYKSTLDPIQNRICVRHLFKTKEKKNMSLALTLTILPLPILRSPILLRRLLLRPSPPPIFSPPIMVFVTLENAC
jgi:hypothetical protein